MEVEDVPFGKAEGSREYKRILSEVTKAHRIESYYPQLKGTSAHSAELAPYGRGEGEPHVSREFMEGHQHSIVFLAHIENGKDLVSVDEAGHVFVWTYHVDFLSPEGKLRPSHKYRIPLHYLKLVRTQQKVNKNAASQQKNKDAGSVYRRSLDYRRFLHGDGRHVYVVPSSRLPQDGYMFLHEVHFDSKKEFLHTMIGSYVRREGNATLGKIKASKDRRHLAIELEKDHLFGDDQFRTVEIVLFQTVIGRETKRRGGSHQLMHTKMSFSFEKRDRYDFELSDEVTTLQVPYLYFLHCSIVEVISPLTNMVVRSFDFGRQMIDSHPRLFKEKLSEAELKSGLVDVFDRICLSHYLEVYLASVKLDCLFFLKLEDANSGEDLGKVVA